MSPNSPKWWSRVRDPLIAAAAAMVITGAANFYETTAAHRRDLEAVSGKLERILDALCELKPSARACSAAGDVKLDTTLPVIPVAP